jgi:hypothetical protein
MSELDPAAASGRQVIFAEGTSDAGKDAIMAAQAPATAAPQQLLLTPDWGLDEWPERAPWHMRAALEAEVALATNMPHSSMLQPLAAALGHNALAIFRPSAQSTLETVAAYR